MGFTRRGQASALAGVVVFAVAAVHSATTHHPAPPPPAAAKGPMITDEASACRVWAQLQPALASAIAEPGTQPWYALETRGGSTSNYQVLVNWATFAMDQNINPVIVPSDLVALKNEISDLAAGPGDVSTVVSTANEVTGWCHNPLIESN